MRAAPASLLLGFLICLAGSPRIAAATELSLFPPASDAAHFFSGTASDASPPSPRLFRSSPWRLGPAPDLRDLPEELAGASDAPAGPGPAPAPKLFTRGTTFVTAGVLVAMTAWAALGVEKDDYNAFFVQREKFFGKDTYAGGADKCSHFILSAFLARELTWVYEKQGHSRDQSLALSLGVTILSGVIQEVGDGFTPYGYAWEDIVADTLGGITGAALTRYELNDLIGLRFGFVPNDVPDDPCCAESLGDNYAKEVYSGDLKLAGLAKRMHFNPGPARFLMLSATYSTKGYGFDPARPDRQRNVGIDVGLNMPEILSAVGVPENTWWGVILYKGLNLLRVPFTAVGIRYDLNHKKWHGPDTGNGF